MTNCLTFDLEDWRPLADEWVTGRRTGPSGRVPEQVNLILKILDASQVRATFFCLGSVAECHPQIIRRLRDAGHEIASHGYGHQHLHRLTPESFEADLHRAEEALGSITGERPRGYRAPQFSITHSTWWALEILARRGYQYDSSIFPIRHHRYGVRVFSNRPCQVQTPAGPIWELPPAVLEWRGLRLPIAGGGYARLLPAAWWLRAIVTMNRHQVPVISYFHPYEYDPQPLRLSVPPDSFTRRLRTLQFTWLQNLCRASMTDKLSQLIRHIPMDTCRNYLQAEVNPR